MNRKSVNLLRKTTRIDFKLFRIKGFTHLIATPYLHNIFIFLNFEHCDLKQHNRSQPFHSSTLKLQSKRNINNDLCVD